MNIKSFFARQSIARNSIYTIASEVIINILAVFVAGYVARKLGVLDYGRFVFAFAFVDTFTLFTNMGVHTVQVREISKDKNGAPSLFGTTLVFRILSASLTFIVVAGVISFLDYPLITKQVVYIAGLALIFNYISDSCKAAFKAYETMQFIAVLSLVNSCISMILRVLVVYLGFGLLTLSWTIALISFISALLPYIVLRSILFKPVFTFNYQKLKSIFVLTLPFYFSMVFWVIYKRADVLLLSFLRSEKDVGWYSAGFMLISRLTFISSSVVSAIFPVISRLSKDKKAEAVKAYKGGLLMLFLIGSPIAIGCHMGAEKIIMLIYDSQYENTILVLQLLAWTVPFVFLGQLMVSMLNAFGKEKIVAKTTATYVTANIIANFILIPRYGFIGSSISLLISEFVNVTVNWICISYYLKVNSFSGKFINAIAAGGIMGGVLYFSLSYPILIFIGIGVLTYLVAIIALRAYPPRAVEQVKNMIIHNKTL